MSTTMRMMASWGRSGTTTTIRTTTNHRTETNQSGYDDNDDDNNRHQHRQQHPPKRPRRQSMSMVATQPVHEVVSDARISLSRQRLKRQHPTRATLTTFLLFIIVMTLIAIPMGPLYRSCFGCCCCAALSSSMLPNRPSYRHRQQLHLQHQPQQQQHLCSLRRIPTFCSCAGSRVIPWRRQYHGQTIDRDHDVLGAIARLVLPPSSSRFLHLFSSDENVNNNCDRSHSDQESPIHDMPTLDGNKKRCEECITDPAKQQEEMELPSSPLLLLPTMMAAQLCRRRPLIVSAFLLPPTAATMMMGWSAIPPAAVAAPGSLLFPRRSRNRIDNNNNSNNNNDASSTSLYVVTPEQNSTDRLQRTPVVVLDETSNVSSELCLLKLLPIKNRVFRQLQDAIESITALQLAVPPTNNLLSWKIATADLQSCLRELDAKRGLLEPAFNPDDSPMMQITKGERAEQLIEAFRDRLVQMIAATNQTNVTETFLQQKQTLLAMSAVGELLVSSFPYKVPREGKFSYLPRLLGRARVTYTFRRRNTILGNVTIVADGYTAPITAGNFVDLSIREFYTGLPIKFMKRRVGSTGIDFDVANIPILGSFQEGFYDPLTAQLRRIPLEIIRLETGTSLPSLSYSRGLNDPGGDAVLEPTSQSKPLLSFQIPGLVAMNHPDKNLDGGSSEFFALQRDSIVDERRHLLDGEYAPFGYIIEGYELFQTLKPNDIIDATIVDEWGKLNLIKIRQSSFSEVVQGSEASDV